MKNRLHILSLLLALVAVCSCTDDKNTIVPDQREAFLRYVTSNNLEAQDKNGVYQCVLNADRAGYDTEPTIAHGDVVDFHYTAYVFRSSTYNADRPIYSTSPQVIDTIRKYQGANAIAAWEKGPHQYKIGESKMIKGLEYGLIDLHRQDTAMLLITSNLAFGGDAVGIIPEDTPMVYLVFIDQVTKQ